MAAEAENLIKDTENRCQIISQLHFLEGGLIVLHWIAFVVIGCIIGWWFSRQATRPAISFLLGLIGALVGGLLVYYGAKGHHGIIITYGSIIASIILSLILAFFGRGSKKA